ncbi:hypothetical protein WOLCODRAFT_141047 [Wolfiporia cocos MD-104 SS10]|uniref:Uncharacterized protein n=1 Tax=Wolfiporia cocos (strain MD-104) TaxID=742152 RepID=A0A2H3J9Y4_WOLCO|nr:hypothetical protein WOLCODRAFT_141047 [Wolfiporia cocos MD-104 SS10]
MDDRPEAAPAAPTTPPQKSSTSLHDAAGDAPPNASPSGSSTGNANAKSPLLSRIGSVGRKWGMARKKRSSTGPAEVAAMQERGRDPEPREEQRSRPQSVLGLATPPTPSSKGGWFFRAGGGGGPGPPPSPQSPLRHEESIEKLIAEAEVLGVESLSRKGKTKAEDDALDDVGGHDDGASETHGSSRVPSASLLFGHHFQMQKSSSHSSSNSSWASWKPPPVSRFASQGSDRPGRSSIPNSRASSRGRSVSAARSDRSSTLRKRKSKDATAHAGATPNENAKSKRRDESVDEVFGGKDIGRGFIGSMRRISLVGSARHKKTKSFAHVGEKSYPDVEATPRPPSRPMRCSHDALLPPAELRPPSPPVTPGKAKKQRQPRHEHEQSAHEHPSTRSPNGHRVLSQSRSATPLLERHLTSATVSSPLPSPDASPSSSPLSSPSRARQSPQHVASLGRATQLPTVERDASASPSVPRRNSLGDLKIPTRISQAQVGLRRDLGMVREFANSVEQLKQLQTTYRDLVDEIRNIVIEQLAESSDAQRRTPATKLFDSHKSSTRSRSQTNPAYSQFPTSPHNFRATFHDIETRYQLSWECAELIIDLGSGPPAPPVSAPPLTPPPGPLSAPAFSTEGRPSRERAITLSGDEPKPGPGSPAPAGTSNPAQWRATTGRHDLSSRQLVLLREMLNSSDSATPAAQPQLPIPEEDLRATKVNRSWRWGDVTGNTVMLPSDGDGAPASGPHSPSANQKRQKRRSSRLRGIRDMLRSLKKTYADSGNSHGLLVPVAPSTISVSASTDSSVGASPQDVKAWPTRRRRAKTSTGPESSSSVQEQDGHSDALFSASMSLQHKTSPRRPSLASIFRLTQRSKSGSSTIEQQLDEFGFAVPSESAYESAIPNESAIANDSDTNLADEEDWDRVDSASDIERDARRMMITPDGFATVRGKDKSPYPSQQQAGGEHMTGASRSSLWSEDQSAQKRTSPRIPNLQLVWPSPARLRKRGDKTYRPSSRGKGKPASAAGAQPSSSRLLVSNVNVVAVDPSNPPRALPIITQDLPQETPEFKLAMTPENIRPLLENAREVLARCDECIVELRSLLATATGAA